jgi:hypothetical protein
MRKGKKAPKLPYGIDDAFMSEVASLDVNGKKSLIARLEAGKQDAKQFLAENESVLHAKASLAELVGPSRDAIKAVNNKQKYIVEELNKLNAF